MAKTYTHAEIVDAVFHAHQKPEVLADMIATALGVTVPERPANLVLGAKPETTTPAAPSGEGDSGKSDT